MQFKEACDKVRKTIKKDDDLYFGYQSNIAMAMYDEIRRLKKLKPNIRINNSDLLESANRAAQNFLDMWIK